jgi:hypothetical protein
MSGELKTNVNSKVESPATRFGTPQDVVQDETLSEDEKTKALNTWEQDARQLLTASNEGMTGSEEGTQPDDHSHLGEVFRAKNQVGEKPKHKLAH